MNKTTKKTASKPRAAKATDDHNVKPATSSPVGGGDHIARKHL
jgi:hypothetical protein